MKISISSGDSDKLIVYMGDVYNNLIGKKVDILTDCQSTLIGMLMSHNGHILQLFNHTTKINIYISVDKIVAISSEE